jgi:hypothetical protein
METLISILVLVICLGLIGFAVRVVVYALSGQAKIDERLDKFC